MSLRALPLFAASLVFLAHCAKHDSTQAASPQAQSVREVPIDADDGAWGAPLAPVTLVVFTDLECPYCAQAHAGVKALERRYGPSQLRVVVKHLPLTNHAGAIPAARVAQAVLQLGGSERFFQYIELAFAHQSEVAQGRALALADGLGLDPTRLAEVAGSAEIGAQLLADVRLADKLEVAATPHFRINGRGLTGVQPLEVFSALVERELAAARELRARGWPATSVYAERVRVNSGLPSL